MKKLLLFYFLLISIISCHKDDSIYIEEIKTIAEIRNAWEKCVVIFIQLVEKSCV